MGRARDLANLINGQGTLPDGAVPSGTVVQVVQSETAANTEATITSTTSNYDLTSTMSVVITPKFLNSTMYISGAFYMVNENASTVVGARLVRTIGGTTTVVSPATTGSQSSTTSDGFAHVYSSPAIPNTMGLNQTSYFMSDQSLSISQHTYSLQLDGNGATHDIYFNQYGVSAVSYDDSWTPVSFMQVMEVKG
mgnify:FL=1